MPRIKPKTSIPKITLWGIDSHNVFNALVYEGIPPQNLPQYHPHQKKLFVISYDLKGSFKSFINFKPHLVTKGTLGMVNPNQIHFIQPVNHDLVKAIVVAFHPTLLNKLSLKPQVNALIRASDVHLGIENQKPEDVAPLLMTTILSEFEHNGKRVTQTLTTLLSLLLTHLAEASVTKRPSNRSHHLYHQFLEKLEDNVGKTHRVSDYAELLGVSEKTLNRACHTVVQSSASSIIQQKINAEAQRFLQYDKTTAKEIAYRLGFNDPVQFSKFFKQSNGLTPLAYRNYARRVHAS